MNRIALSMALCLAAAAMASAQEVKDGTYVHKDYTLKLTVPDAKAFVIRTQNFEYEWSGTLCEAASEDDQIGAVLVLYTSAMKVDKYAKWRADSWAKTSGVKQFKEIKSSKLERKTGDWLQQEHFMEFNDYEFHYLETFIAKGKYNIELSVWCPETLWEENKDKMYKLAEGLKYGEDATAVDVEKPVKPKDLPDLEKPKDLDPKNKVEHPWAKYGEGTWVEHQISTKMSGMDSEMSTKRTLVKKGSDKLTFKTESKMTQPTAMDMPAQENQEDAMIATSTGGTGGAEPKKLGEGEEELEVAGKNLKCKWIEYEMDSGGKKMTSKSWTSDEVPGGLVKSVTKSDDMESVMVCTGFEKK